MEAGWLRWLRDYTLRKRTKRFFDFIAPYGRPLKIVDLGGTASYWQRMGVSEGDEIEVTLVNNHHIDTSQAGYDNSIPYIKHRNQDVTTLTVEEFQAFDVIMSNSMIEHLEGESPQRALCEVIEASGKPYFIQVPNQYALIDPHFPHPIALFFAAWPRNMQIWALQKHACGSAAKATDRADAERRLKYYHPFGRARFRSYLPSGKLLTERHLGIPMSLIMMRH